MVQVFNVPNRKILYLSIKIHEAKYRLHVLVKGANRIFGVTHRAYNWQ